MEILRPEKSVELLMRDGTTVTGTYLGTAFNTLLKLRLPDGAIKHVRIAELRRTKNGAAFRTAPFCYRVLQSSIISVD